MKILRFRYDQLVEAVSARDSLKAAQTPFHDCSRMDCHSLLVEDADSHELAIKMDAYDAEGVPPGAPPFYFCSFRCLAEWSVNFAFMMDNPNRVSDRV